MKRRGIIVLVGVLGLLALLLTGSFVLASPPRVDPPVDSEINYQGRLTDSGGNPLNGTYDLQFQFWDAESGGSQVGTDITVSNVAVDNGLFNVKIPVDHSNFNGQALWVRVRVRPSGGTWDDWMMPRQEILPVPYAVSLRPGAIISTGSSSIAYDPVLEIRHNVSSTLDLDGLHVFSESHGEAIEGYSKNGKGVFGSTEASGTTSDAGVYGSAGNGAPGVRGHAAGTETANSYGGYFTSEHRRGLYASGDPGGGWYDAMFAGPVGIYVADDINKGGTCSAGVETADDDVRKLYAIESPNVWFEDFGQGQLANGQATVTMEPLFLSTINTEAPYHVFLTPLADCNGLYVTNKTATSFEVRELGGGTANVAFDYRIVALRKGYEEVRMEPLAEGEGDA